MNALLAVVVVLVPLVAAIAFVVTGLARTWLRWPWLVGAGFAVVPAAYLTFQSACGHIGGTCPRPGELHASHWAVVALVLLVAGMVVAASGRRRGVACVLLGLGELWMVQRLWVAHQRFAAELLAVLLVAGVVAEVAAWHGRQAGTAHWREGGGSV
jgi:hypothetical protein